MVRGTTVVMWFSPVGLCTKYYATSYGSDQCHANKRSETKLRKRSRRNEENENRGPEHLTRERRKKETEKEGKDEEERKRGRKREAETKNPSLRTPKACGNPVKPSNMMLLTGSLRSLHELTMMVRSQGHKSTVIPVKTGIQ